MPTNQDTPQEIVIRNADDVWSVIYEYGISSSIRDILDYFSSQTDKKEFGEFCYSLDHEQLKEVLDYFLGNFSQQKFLMLFKELRDDQKASIISGLLNDVCESKSKDIAYFNKIIQFRKNLSTLGDWKNEKNNPKNVNDAIESTKDNSFEKVIYYLSKHPNEIGVFVRRMADENGEMALNGLALELMNYLPLKSEGLAPETDMPFAA